MRVVPRPDQVQITLQDKHRGDVIVFCDDDGLYHITYQILDQGGEVWENVGVAGFTTLSAAMVAVAALIKLNVENDFYF